MIHCAGLLVADILIKPFDADNFRGASSRVDELAMLPGGNALNIACALSRLNVPCALYGRVGNDPLKDFLLTYAQNQGVDTKHVVTDASRPTAACVAMVSRQGERHLALQAGANACFDACDIPKNVLQPGDILVVSSLMVLDALDHGGLERLFRRAKAQGVITCFDTAWDTEGIWLPKIESALPFTDIFLPSLNEAQQITNRSTLEEMIAFFEPYGLSLLVIKRGASGATVTDFNARWDIDAFKANCVDSTGAGDAFVAGFLSGLHASLPPDDCARVGCALAAMCIESIGASAGSTLHDLNEFLQMHKCSVRLLTPT